MMLAGFFVCMLLSGCAPRLQTLESYKTAESFAEGVLWVPLRTVDKEVDIYREFGQDNRAARVEERAKVLNAKITTAFHDHFDFCPVVFFELESDKNPKKLPTPIVDSMNPYPDSVLAHKPRFFARFSEVIVQRGESSRSEMAIVLLDSNRVELVFPFPAAQDIQGYPSKNGIETAVKNLNKNLYDYKEKADIARLRARLKTLNKEIRQIKKDEKAAKKEAKKAEKAAKKQEANAPQKADKERKRAIKDAVRRKKQEERDAKKAKKKIEKDAKKAAKAAQKAAKRGETPPPTPQGKGGLKTGDKPTP